MQLTIPIELIETRYFRPLTVYKSRLKITDDYIEQMLEVVCDEREDENDIWNTDVKRTKLKLLIKSKITFIELYDFWLQPNLKEDNTGYSVHIHSADDCISINYA